MNDKELLELAAKAGGIVGDYVYYYDSPDYYYSGNAEGILVRSDNANDYVWNPLTDDGDALRLAVGLNLTIQQNFGGVYCYNSPDYPNKPSGMIEVYESKRSTDPYAATRRSIVRAAAEIGRSIK